MNRKDTIKRLKDAITELERTVSDADETILFFRETRLGKAYFTYADFGIWRDELDALENEASFVFSQMEGCGD